MPASSFATPQSGLRSTRPFSSLRRAAVGMSLLLGFSLLFGVANAQARPQNRTHTPTKISLSKRKPSVPATLRNRTYPYMRSVSGLKHHIERLEAKYRASHPKEEEEREREREGSTKPKAEGEEEESGLDYLEAHLYRMKLRAYPRDVVNWGAYPRAAWHRSLMPPARIGKEGRLGGINPHGISGNWQFIGPNKLDVPYRTYYGVDTLNGRANAVAFDPVTPQTYYMGTAGGGVWKTVDGGVTWIPLSDNWPLMHVSSLAIDPTNNKTIYAGTGDFDGYEGSGFGIMKSTDSGATWVNLGLNELSGTSISDIVVDPENPQIITVTQGRPPNWWGYVWRSVNGGATWTKVVTDFGIYSDLALGAKDNTGKRYMYAIGGLNPGSRLLRSSDRGATWTNVSTPFTNVYQGGVRVATSNTTPATVYIISGHDQKIYKSVDAGANWTNITAGFPGGYNWSQADYDIRLTLSTQTVNNVTKDVIYVGLIDLVQSPDGGSTWRSIGNTYTNNAILHNDQHSMAINPANPNEALVGCDGGVFYLNYQPDANTWTLKGLNPTGGATQLYRIAVNPADPATVLGGAQDNATPYSNGDISNWINVGGGDGGFAAIYDSALQFATVQFLGIYITTNGWLSDSYTKPSTGSDNVPFIAPIALSVDGKTLYAGTNYLYSLDVATRVWTARLGAKKLTTNELTYIAVAPTDANRIYTAGGDGQLWMTTNKGTSWTEIEKGVASLPGYALTSIAVHPTKPNQILVTFSGAGTDHVFLCNDTTAGANRTWLDVSGAGVTGLPDISHNSIVYDLDTPDTTWYVGTDVGVFITTNAGATWSNATSPLGLPNVEVSDLKIVPGKYLVAGTFGRGIWRISLGSSVSPTVTVSPTTTVGGAIAKGVVTIPTAAGVGGTTVSLESSAVSVVAVPQSVTIPAGAKSASFNVQTFGVPSSTNVNISASISGVSSTASVRVVPATPLAVKFNPAAVIGGISSTGTLLLNGQAPSGDLIVNLVSDNTAVTLPATVTVPSGATSVTFTAQTTAVTTQTAVTVTATSGGVAAKGNLQVFPASALSFTITPNVVVGGISTKGKVTLSGKAPTGGIVVTLASDNPNAVPPATAIVPEGTSSVTFTIATLGVAVSTNTTLSASANGAVSTATLQLLPLTPVSVTLAPSSVVGGNSSKGTVVLNGVAPVGGAVVTLTSGDSIVTIPASITVPAGSTKMTFKATTAKTITSKTVTVTAVINSVSAKGTLQVLKAGDSASLVPISVTISPAQVTGGVKATGTVTLSGLAPTGGLVVNLSSSSSAATVPATLTVPAGATKATFSVSTTPVPADTEVKVTATANGASVESTLTLLAPRPVSLTLKPPVVVGGTSSKATVVFTGKIPTGGLSMTIQIGAATQTITLSVGATSATFTVPTSPVTQVTSLKVSATLSGASVSATLTVLPSGSSSLSFAPPSVTGGLKSVGTLTLSGKAPTGGLTFNLSSSDTATAAVPATVTVAAGASSANFTVTTFTTGADKYVTITATQGALVASGSLLVTTVKVASVTFDSPTLQGGTSTKGTVTLDAPAPAGGIVVTLASGNSAVTVPASLAVNAGSKSARFTVKTSKVGFNTSVVVTATANSSSAKGTINLTP